ncbi:MAG TPA: FGGY family carbohydrate kinase [bacterium]|nr:FGGY family carbohydrate kinase [bacterium]
MSDRLLLALDSGSQSSRALLFDAAGNILASSQHQHAPMKYPMPGAVEQDPLDIREALYASVRECLNRWGGDVGRIAGAALTTQRNTMLPVAADGAPLADAVSWLDRRTASVDSEPTAWLRWLLKMMGEKALIPRLVAKSVPRQWRERCPDILDSTWKIASIEGWLNHQLTGRVAVGPGGVVGTWSLAVKHLAWSDSNLLYTLLGFRREWLPDIVPSGQKIGEITATAAAQTGLPQGLPLFACGGDKQAEALGGGLLSSRRGEAAVSLGTGSSICVPWTKALESRNYQWIAMGAAEPNAFCLEYLLFRGMWTARWFANELARDLVQSAAQTGKPAEALLCEEASKVPAGCDGLMVWPRWSPTLQQPRETGAAVGLRETHTRAHFFRALLEGIAYDLRRGRHILERATKMKIERLLVAGGGARSRTIVQILCDVLDLPVMRPESEELSARGAAMVAAIGCGVYADAPEAVRAMASPAETFTPQADNAARYETIYRTIYLPGLKTCHRISSSLRGARDK